MNQPPIRYLVLWLTTDCNLHCKYCYRSEEPPLAISRELIEASLYMASSSGLPFHIQLAGGEPTLEPDLIEFVGKKVRSYGLPTTIAIHTNGTLIEESIVKILKKYDIRVGVSIDGPPGIQETLRGESGATFRGLLLLEKMNMPIKVTTVLSSINVGHLFEHILSLAHFSNIRGIGLDPIVLKGRASNALELLPSPEALRTGIKNMLKALREIQKVWSVPMDLRELELVRRSLLKGVRHPYCHALKGESIAVHPDGTVYPCGQTVGDPAMAVGTIDSIDWEKLKNCYKEIKLAEEECFNCPLEGRCPGDCPSRLHYNDEKGKKMACLLYQTIAEALKPGDKLFSNHSNL